MNSYVNDFNHTVRTYYQELKHFQPLSKEEEKELIRKAKENNDLKARDKILTANLKFVFDIAKRYKGCGVSIDDLIAEGNVGLTKALDKFNVEYDVKFISYAIWWIRQAMQEYIKKKCKQKSVECFDEDELLRPIGHEYNLTDEEDEYVFKIDTILSNEEDEEKAYQHRKERKIINQLMSKLDYREKYIIKSYYGLESKSKTLEEIGNDLSLSKERVRQVKEKSLRKLRTEALVLS